LKPNRFLVPIAFLLLISCAKEPERPPVSTGRTLTPTGALTFLDASGDSITTLRIALAQTDQEISTGLMDVRSMAADEGMLFIFGSDEPRSFWMANTPLSLDMFFVDSGFRIRRIHASTTPLSHESYASGDPVRYVIETNAGYALTHDITEGHSIRIHD
jgi:uncharacterized membrane protein (UPF0127 family)